MNPRIQGAMPYQIAPALCIGVINCTAGVLSSSTDRPLLLGILGGQFLIAIGPYFIAPYFLAIMNEDLRQKFSSFKSPVGQRYSNQAIFLFRIFLLAMFESIWTLNLASGCILFRTRQEIEMLFAESRQPIAFAVIIAGTGIAAVAHFYTARHTLNKV